LPPVIARNIRTIAVLVVVAVIVVGFILFRDRLSNDVTSLQPGECFDQPAAGVTEVSDVQRQPCNEPHDAEVLALVTDPAAADAIYPVLGDHFRDLAVEQCLPVVTTFVGESLDSRPELDVGFYYPTRESWNGGDRGVTCYLSMADGSKMSAPLRVAGQQ